MATSDSVSVGTPSYGARGKITIAFTLKPSSVGAGERLCGNWSNTASERQILIANNNTNEVGFLVEDASINRYGRQTDSLNMTAGTTYRMVMKWRGSSDGGPTMKIFANGVDLAISEWIGSVSFAAFRDGSGDTKIGRLNDGSDCIDGDYSEFAMWEEYLDDAACIAISNGFSPSFYRAGGMFYVDCLRDNSIDRWKAATVTETGVAVATHPSVIYPARAQVGLGTVAAGVTIPIFHHHYTKNIPGAA